MPIRLQTLRFYVTTKDVPFSRTNDPIYLIIDLPGSKPAGLLLNNPGNDRERGKTDFYEISLIDGMRLSDANGDEVGFATSGSTTSAYVPPGVEFQSWDSLRQLRIRLKILGSNAWHFFKYHLLARVVYLDPIENPIDAPYAILFHDWLLLSSLDEDVILSSQNSDGGGQFHQIAINGVFPQVP